MGLSTTFSNEALSAFIINAPLKPTTKKSYLANINTILRHVGNNTTLFDVLKDHSSYFPMISRGTFEIHKKNTTNKIRHGPEGTLRALVKTLLSLIKFTGLKEAHPTYYMGWHSHFVELSHVLTKREDNNISISATELTWSDILESASNLKPNSLEQVTLALYTIIPPRRQQDYWKLLLNGNDSDSTGHFDLISNPPTITVTSFKTVDKYDTYSATIPESLVEIVKNYVKARKNSSIYLFCKKNGEAYGTLSSFTDANNKTIKRALNHPHASINSLRHAAASMVAVDPNMLRGEKKKWALAMGHSLSMQGQYVVVQNKKKIPREII